MVRRLCKTLQTAPVRFWEINSGIERQQIAQHPPLFLVGCASAAFPGQNQRRFNPHFPRYLIGMKPLFVALGLNVITKRFYESGDVLSAVPIRGYMGAGYANPPLCNTQQGYSPLPRGEDFGDHGLGDLIDRPANPVARIFKETANDSPSCPFPDSIRVVHCASLNERTNVASASISDGDNFLSKAGISLGPVLIALIISSSVVSACGPPMKQLKE